MQIGIQNRIVVDSKMRRILTIFHILVNLSSKENNRKYPKYSQFWVHIHRRSKDSVKRGIYALLPDLRNLYLWNRGQLYTSNHCFDEPGQCVVFFFLKKILVNLFIFHKNSQTSALVENFRGDPTSVMK